MNRAFLFLLFLLLAGKMCAQQVAGTLTLKEAEQRFLERNLSLIAERYNIDMAQAQVLQAKLFENPVISLEQNVYNRLNGKYFDFGKEGEAVVEIEQVIHLAGQRNKQVRLEKINKEIAEYQFEEVMRTLRQELNEKFVEVYFLSKSIAIYEKEVNSLQVLLGGMKIQQEKGNISLMEISRLESMLFSLRKEKNEREKDLLTARGELNLLLNLPEDTQVQLSLDEEVLQQLDLSQLSFADLKAIINERPDQKIARSTVNASRANLKLQKSMAFPEFSVKGNYDRVGNFINDYFAIGVSLSVPIFNRNQGNIKAARFSIQQAGVQQEYAANRADMELFTAYTSLEKATQLYQSTNMDLERNFEKLITGVNENFTRKNISLLEFIDYYDSYKETCIQLYEIKKNVFLAMENLNKITIHKLSKTMNWNKFLPCILFGSLLGACSGKGEQPKVEPTTLCLTDSLLRIVSVDTVHVCEVVDELTLNGRVTFNQDQVANVYPMFGGTVTELRAEIGDFVHKGEVLAVIRSGEVADYEKQLKEAEQQLLLARRNMDATQDMYTSGMASDKDVLQAKQELASAEAEERRIKEIFSIYHFSGNAFYQLKSPVSGFIVEKQISRDMQLRPDQGDALFTISGLSDVWVMADVYESDISKVSEGADVRISTLAYPERTFTGTIDKAYHLLDSESKTMNVRIKLKNEDYLLKPGMFTNVSVKCKAEDTSMPRIDSHALVFEGGKNYVVTVEPDQRLKIKEVDVYKQLSKECYVRSGLSEGDRVLNNNVLLVYNALNAD